MASKSKGEANGKRNLDLGGNIQMGKKLISRLDGLDIREL